MHSFKTFLSLLPTTAFLFSTFLCAAATSSHTGNRIRHRVPVEPPFKREPAHFVARGVEGEVSSNSSILNEDGLAKRDGSARFTWFHTGLGACGGVNQASDFIVAINQPQWDGGSHCYEMVTITYNGKSVQAQIVDECMDCPPNALDLSLGLFRFLVGPSQDQVNGDWSFGGETKQTSTSPAQQAPTSTKTSSRTTPTSTKESSSSSTKAKPTSTSTRSSTSFTSSSSTASSTALATSSATTGTVSQSAAISVPTSVDYLSMMNELMFSIGNIIMQAPAAAARG